MEKYKKKIKWLVIIAVVLIIYVGVILLLNNKNNEVSNNYVIVGNEIIWHRINNQWYQEVNVSKDLLKQKFIYDDGQKKTQVNDLKYLNDQWHFFDKDHKELSSDQFRIAYTYNLNIKLANFMLEGYDSNDDKFLLKLFELTADEWSVLKNQMNKVSYDFDNDGNVETIYLISSTSTTVQNDGFDSYLFLVKNNEIVNVIGGGEDSFGIIEVLDIDNDDNYEIVISKGVINNPTFRDCYQIYKIVDGTLTLYQDCLFNQ